MPEQLRLDVPDVPSETLVGARAQESPDPGATVSDRLTVPLKPSSAATEMVAVAVVSVGVVIAVGLAEIVKSWTVTAVVAVWVIPLLVPIVVTLYVPDCPEHENVEAALVASNRLLEARVHAKPADGEIEIDRETVPVNPNRLDNVNVPVPVAPALLTRDELVVSVKSWTFTLTVAKWLRDPLVPVIATL